MEFESMHTNILLEYRPFEIHIWKADHPSGLFNLVCPPFCLCIFWPSYLSISTFGVEQMERNMHFLVLWVSDCTGRKDFLTPKFLSICGTFKWDGTSTRISDTTGPRQEQKKALPDIFWLQINWSNLELETARNSSLTKWSKPGQNKNSDDRHASLLYSSRIVLVGWLTSWLAGLQMKSNQKLFCDCGLTCGVLCMVLLLLLFATLSHISPEFQFKREGWFCVPSANWATDWPCRVWGWMRCTPSSPMNPPKVLELIALGEIWWESRPRSRNQGRTEGALYVKEGRTLVRMRDSMSVSCQNSEIYIFIGCWTKNRTKKKPFNVQQSLPSNFENFGQVSASISF